VVVCLERGAALHMAQLMPLPLTASCFSKIQIGFTFLVPAHLGSPGKRAVKRMCVCVRYSLVSGHCDRLLGMFVSVFTSAGREWSTYVRDQWTSTAWYVETSSPSSKRIAYYVDEALRTIDIADDESFVACLHALSVLLPQVTESR